MASGDKNFTLGLKGVVLDKAPTHADPSELLKAQNATRDPLGVDGGLKLRPALGKFNGGAAAGSILGGISVPIFNYVDSRSLIIGQINSGTEAWYTSSNLFSTSAAVSALAAYQDVSDYYSLGTNVSRIGVFFNGQLYYAAAGYTPGTTSPTIRVYNGTDDRELCKVLPATTFGITGMFSAKGYMYVLTLDSGTTDADFVGRCFRLSQNGHLDQIGTAFATGYVPQVLIVYNDSIYVACNRLTTTNEARVYRINPTNESSWTLDATMDADDYQITGFASFQGLLYATTKNGGAATKGKIKKRSITGTWSTVDSTTNNSGTYEDIIAWEGALYASSRSYATTTTTAVIRKSTDGTTWSTVYNSSSTAGVGWLQVIGLRLFSFYGSTILHTTSGTSYTSATPSGSGNVAAPLGVLLPSGAAEWEEPVDAGLGTSGTPSVSVVNNNSTLTISNDYEDYENRKRYRWYAISGSTSAQFGWGINNSSSFTDSDGESDGVYLRLQSGGTPNAIIGLYSTTGILSTKYADYRGGVIFRAVVRTYGTNQNTYRIRVGFVNASAFVNSDVIGAQGVCFRYTHGASGADSGNWQLEVSDGSTQVNTDTGMAVQGGTAAGSHCYEMTLEFTSSTSVTWTIADITAGTSQTGTRTLTSDSPAWNTGTQMYVHNGGHAIAATVVVWKISRMTLGIP